MRRYASRALLLGVVLAAMLVGPVWSGWSPSLAAATEMPLSAFLVEEAGRFDGTVVEFEGEAIGEAMVRGEMAWIHLNDDAYRLRNIEEGQPLGGYNTGQAVWLPADLADRIGVFGDYHAQGDVVRVVGRFNAACPEHGGDMDIHAEELVVLRAGHPVVDPVRNWKLALAAASALAAGLTYLAHVRRGPGPDRARRA